MTADQQHSPAGPEALADYLASMDGEGAPLLGHLVLYSIFSGEVTPDAMSQWFAELGLDPAFCPGTISATDVYERVTGPSGVKRSYPIGEVQTRRQRREEGAKGRKGLLMIRHVSRGKDRIVRHLVREVRDEEQVRLSYDARLAGITFVPDGREDAAAGAVRNEGAGEASAQALHKRFADLEAAAAEHEQLLGGGAAAARAGMQVVQMQLAGLLARAS